MRLINIEGNIGSGKSTLAQVIADEYGAVYHKELANEETNGLLKKFYDNKKKYGFELQIHFLGKRVNDLRNSIINNDDIVVMDRSIYGDLIFAKNLFKNNFMTKSQYDNYFTLFNDIIQFYPIPDIMIYLDIPIDIIANRIKTRNRGNENLIEINYLKEINNYYNAWISSYDNEKIVLNPDTFDINNSDQVVDLLELIGEKI